MTTILAKDVQIFGTWESKAFSAKNGGMLRLRASNFSGCNPSLKLLGMSLMAQGSVELILPLAASKKRRTIELGINGTSAGALVSLSLIRNRGRK